jgi:putative NADPH-quinone reductase
MDILVILGHPDPASLNHALAEAVTHTLHANGHRVIYHDLYREGFDAILPADEVGRTARLDWAVEEHCAQLAAAGGIVVVHPNWWGQPPAILKGWIDRVFRAGVAYRFLEGDGGEGVPVGLLRAHAAIVLNTANTPQQREDEVFGDPLQALWQKCIFELCGVTCFHRRMYRVICTSTPAQRQAWLADAQALANEVFPAAAA